MTALPDRAGVPRAESLAATEPPGIGVPVWVSELVRVPTLSGVDGSSGAVRACSEDGARFSLVTASFNGAREMDILTFQQRVVESYKAVFGQLEMRDRQHPVRFWAFVPGIHDSLSVGLDRYMAFNAGRYGAYSSLYGNPDSFDRSIPTASGVGVEGNTFVLYCLAADKPGSPIENPRQIPAYHYSRRFGPMPPCFARATLLSAQSDESMLLVGGTASIAGEESVHVGNVEDQVIETFRNLASLVACAAGSALPDIGPRTDLAPFLAAFRDLRVYYTRPSDRAPIGEMVKTTVAPRCRVELLHASLCRAELLVEIEGLAFLPSRPLPA